MASTKLNPQAPEFFPINHRFHCYNFNPLPHFFPPPNPNLSFYYSSSGPLHYSNPSYTLPSESPNSDPAVIQQTHTQLLHESAGEVNGAVRSRGGKRGSGRWNRKRYWNWRGSAYPNNNRGERERERVYINDGKKETWRVKGNASDYQKNWKRRQDSGDRRNKPCFFPVLPIESDGENTTVMIRNIPNRYTRELLMEFMDEHCKKENEESKKRNEKSVSAFDFLYLPIDFENKANKGYAFVNFTNPKGVWKFKGAVHNKRWPLFLSNKICSIAYARVQGKEELVRHFESSVFECESDDYLPVCFRPARDGARSLVEEMVIGRRV